VIDHIGFSVADYARSRAFFAAALAPLGFVSVVEVSKEQTGDYEGTGFGPPGRPQFWIGNGEAARGPMHIALVADSRAAVDAFYRAALAAGGRDNGPPGLRPHYHPDYYGAFVLDPDGHNIEAVCRSGEG